jgi:hypothetical protein
MPESLEAIKLISKKEYMPGNCKLESSIGFHFFIELPE